MVRFPSRPRTVGWGEDDLVDTWSYVRRGLSTGTLTRGVHPRTRNQSSGLLLRLQDWWNPWFCLTFPCSPIPLTERDSPFKDSNQKRLVYLLGTLDDLIPTSLTSTPLLPPTSSSFFSPSVPSSHTSLVTQPDSWEKTKGAGGKGGKSFNFRLN